MFITQDLAKKNSFSIYVIKKQLEILMGKKITVSVATQRITTQETES